MIPRLSHSAAPVAWKQQEARVWPWVRTLSGPGLVFVLAAFGPQNMISNAVVGAKYGYALLWILIPLAVARYVVLEASGRYVVVTGESLAEGYTHFGRWVAWLLLISILAKRHLTNLSHILLMGVALEMLLPLHGSHRAAACSLLLWALGFWLMWWGRYARIEKWFVYLGLLLACSLCAMALFARPDAGSILRGFTMPVVPRGASLGSTLFLLMALLGTGTGSIENLKYPAFLQENGLAQRDRLRSNRQQALVSACGLLGAAFLVQVAVAASDRSAQGISTINDLALIIGRVLGEPGRIAIGLGLTAAVFCTFVGANTGYSLITSDLFHRVLRRNRGDLRKVSTGDLAGYRGALLLFTVPPLYVLVTAWQPVWLVLLAAAAMVVLLPLSATALLLLTSNAARMRGHANGWTARAVLVLVIATSLYLTWQNGKSFLSSVRFF